MREKLLNNCRIIDPSQKKDEIGGILIDNNGKIKDIGKNVEASKKNPQKGEGYLIVIKKIAIPGLVDMNVFVGEPGFEYKENFRTLTQASTRRWYHFCCNNAKYKATYRQCIYGRLYNKKRER